MRARVFYTGDLFAGYVEPTEGLAIDPAEYKFIEEIDITPDPGSDDHERLEHLFRLYNRVDGSAFERPGILGITSMSVGDLVALSPDGQAWTWYVCAPSGWDDVTAHVSDPAYTLP